MRSRLLTLALGLAACTCRSGPSPAVSAGPTIRLLRAGASTSCVVLEGGVLACWGRNHTGLLGAPDDGELCADGPCWRQPRVVQGLEAAADVGLSGFHMCVRAEDGAVACRGANHFGQMGAAPTTEGCTVGGDIVPRCSVDLESAEIQCQGLEQVPEVILPCTTTFAMVPDMDASDSLWVSREGTCTVDADGAALCTGAGGLRGLAPLPDRCHDYPCARTPLVLTDEGVVQVGIASDFGCVLRADGTVRCGGTVAAADALRNVRVLAMGSEHACALIADGTVSCWGLNSAGQLGIGSVDPAVEARQRDPAPVPGLRGVTQIATSGGHTCALLGSGQVWCWGSNSAGQVGTGDTRDAPRPMRVWHLPAARAVATGDEHTCALDLSNAVWCWGMDANGELGGAEPATGRCMMDYVFRAGARACSTRPVRVSLPW